MTWIDQWCNAAEVFFWKAFEWVLKPQKKTVWIGRFTLSLWQCKGTRLWKYYWKMQQRPIHRWINKSLSLSKFLSSGRLLKDFVHVIITFIVLWGENLYEIGALSFISQRDCCFISHTGLLKWARNSFHFRSVSRIPCLRNSKPVWIFIKVHSLTMLLKADASKQKSGD